MVKADALAVVYEDDDLLIVDKPGGLVCHSAARPEHATLVSLIRDHGVETPRLINRLDRETSGLVVIAKNERAGRILGKAVLRREIEKTYTAICWGELRQDAGTIDQPISVGSTGLVYTKRIVNPAGKPSVTQFTVTNRLRGFTVVSLAPQTGRAHQLRVHMAWLGHPIVGDKIYGPDERWYLEFIARGVTDAMLAELLLPRHALHAGRVRLRHPSGSQWCDYHAELPGDLRTFIAENL